MDLLNQLKTNTMKKVFVVSIISAVALMGCSKEEQKTQGTYDESVTSFRDMTIPQGFDFSSTKTVYVNFAKQDGATPGAHSVITIQDGDGNMLMKHNADLSQDVELPLEVAATTKELFVVNSAGTGATIKISNNRLTVK